MSKVNTLPLLPDVFVLDSTKLKAYQTCPKRFMFEYVFGLVDEEPSIHLVFGQAWHEAMESLLQTGYTVENVEKAYERFLSVWSTFPSYNHPDAAKSQENALTALYEYCVSYKHDSFRVRFTEIAGEIPISISGDKKLAFKIDAVIEKEGLAYVLEHKTASRVGFEDQHRIGTQVGLYTHVLHSLYDDVGGVIINEAILYKPNTAAAKKRERINEFLRVPISLNKNQLGRWLETANYYYDAIMRDLELFQENLAIGWDKNTCFVQNPSSCFSYNSKCPYFDFCYIWNDYSSRFQDEQIGFSKRVWNPLKEYAANVEKFNQVRTNLVCTTDKES